MSGWPAARAGFLNRVYADCFRPEIYDEAVGLIATAEALGLGSAWVAQHHFGTETGRLPSPLVLLAKASQATRRLQLGTAVIVLPLEPVLRLAEDAAVLDLLADGRLQLGLGSGFEGPVFAAFGQDAADRTGRFEAKIEELLNAISGGALNPEAAPAAALHLSPHAPGLRDRIWESRSAVELIARRGNGLLVATRQDENNAAALIRRYHAAWAAARHSGPPRVALVRGLFPGHDAASVEAEIGPDILSYVRTRVPGVSSADLPAILDRLGVVWGSPARIVDQLAGQNGLAGVDLLLAQVQTFSTTQAQAEARLQLFTERVLPQLPQHAEAVAA